VYGGLPNAYFVPAHLALSRLAVSLDSVFLGQLIAVLTLAPLFSRADGGRLAATVFLAPAVALGTLALVAGTRAARAAAESRG
jgi:hypothetical protein